MKIWMVALVAALGNLGPFGLNPEPGFETGNADRIEECELWISLSGERGEQTYWYQYASADRLKAAIWPVSAAVLYDTFAVEGDCVVSITVTVRVGIDSSYAEASLTVSDVSCDQVAQVVGTLKRQLLAALK